MIPGGGEGGDQAHREGVRRPGEEAQRPQCHATAVLAGKAGPLQQCSGGRASGGHLLRRTAGLRNRGGSEQEMPTQAVKATQSTANADLQYHVDLSLVGHVVAFVPGSALSNTNCALER